MSKSNFSIQEFLGNNGFIGYVVVDSVTGNRMGPDGVWRTPDDKERITYETRDQARQVLQYLNSVPAELASVTESRIVFLPEFAKKCSQCNGTGRLIRYDKCLDCNGQGEILTPLGQHFYDFIRKHIKDMIKEVL